MLATDLPPWKIRVCPACHGMISGAGHFCQAARKWSYADGEMIEVVPCSALDELHRELGLIQTLGAEVERLRAALERIAALEHDFQQRRTVTLRDITGWVREALTPAAGGDSE